MARIILLFLVLAELCISSSLSLGLAGDSNVHSVSRSMNRRLGGMIIMGTANEASEPAEAAVYLDVEGPVGELKARHIKKRSRGVDSSVAGGGVILGGLATSFLVAICCYIRATKRKATGKTVSDSGSPKTRSDPVLLTDFRLAVF